MSASEAARAPYAPADKKRVRYKHAAGRARKRGRPAPVVGDAGCEYLALTTEFDLDTVPIRAELPVDPLEQALLWTDGASRSNPGIGGAGGILRQKAGVVWRFHKPLGTKTSMQAEYAALIQGLHGAASLGVRSIKVHVDNTVVVGQVAKGWRVNAPHLMALADRAKEIADTFEVCEIVHVRRHLNKEADELANLGADGGTPAEDLPPKKGVAAVKKPVSMKAGVAKKKATGSSPSKRPEQRRSGPHGMSRQRGRTR